MSSPSLPSVLAILVAGVVSFLSPCVLPLVPGYLSVISGSTAEDLQTKDPRLLRVVLLHSIMFILGFTVVFVTLGAAATELGQLTRMYRKQLTWIAGVIVILFGLHLTGLLKIKALYADKRFHSLGNGKSPAGAFLVGFAFAFGWTPCIGPILGTILTTASTVDSAGEGVLMLLIYSLGLAVPFLLTAIGLTRFLVLYDKFRRHLRTVEVISGVFLIIMGALIMIRRFALLSSYLGFLQRFSL